MGGGRGGCRHQHFGPAVTDSRASPSVSLRAECLSPMMADWRMTAIIFFFTCISFFSIYNDNYDQDNFN